MEESAKYWSSVKAFLEGHVEDKSLRPKAVFEDESDLIYVGINRVEFEDGMTFWAVRYYPASSQVTLIATDTVYSREEGSRLIPKYHSLTFGMEKREDLMPGYSPPPAKSLLPAVTNRADKEVKYFVKNLMTLKELTQVLDELERKTGEVPSGPWADVLSTKLLEE